MPNVDTTRVLQNFLKNDAHFNENEILDANKTCLISNDEDVPSPIEEPDYSSAEDIINQINQKRKESQQSTPKTEPISESTFLSDTEEPITSETNQETSSLSEKETTSDDADITSKPMTREERKEYILRQKSIEEAKERERLAFEEQLKEKEEELKRIKENSKKRFSFFPKKEKPINKVDRQRDHIEEEKLRTLALFDQKLHCKNANAYGLEVAITSIPQKDSLVFIFCDVNNLKKINDSVGHEGGDKLLTACVSKMIERFTIDQIYRVGGDEFCILYHPTTTEYSIPKMLEEDLSILAKENPLYSFSYGYAVADGIKSIGDLQKESDSKMYIYKEEYKRKHQNNTPLNPHIKVVKDVLSSMIQEFKINEDNINNIFICSHKNQLFVFDTTYDFFDQLESENYKIIGDNQITYCLITYDDDYNNYLVFTENTEIENPYTLLKALDLDIRNCHTQFGQREIRRHRELGKFKEIYIA